MLLQSLRALCKALGGAGSIWKHLEALARATGVPGRFAYGFRTELHFADESIRLGVCHQVQLGVYLRATWRCTWVHTRGYSFERLQSYLEVYSQAAWECHQVQFGVYLKAFSGVCLRES